jgi:structure-specific recognition protein 1
VVDKVDSGSPSDDSEEEGSDASMSGGENEVTRFPLSLTVSLLPVRTRASIVMRHTNRLLDPQNSSKMEASRSKLHVKRKLNSGPDEGSQNKKPKRKK